MKEMEKERRRYLIGLCCLMSLIALALILVFCLPQLSEFSGKSSRRPLEFSILFTIWGFLLCFRLQMNKTKRIICAIIGLLIFWLIIRATKWCINSGSLNRFLWYCFYLPILFIPIFVLMFVSEATHHTLPKWVYLSLFGLNFVFLLFFLTNDLHQLVFVFPNPLPDISKYSYGILYYLATSTAILTYLASFIIYFISGLRRNQILQYLPPMLLLVLYLVYAVVYVFAIDFLKKIHMYDLTIMSSVFILGFIEACVDMGLIQNNGLYHRRFLACELALSIEEKDGTPIYRSKGYQECRSEYLDDTVKSYDNGTLVVRHDLSVIHRYHDEIQKEQKQLLELQQALQEANQKKCEEAREKYQAELRYATDHICREETDAIENRIASLPDSITSENQESVLKQMKLISLGMSYLKMTLMLFLSDMQEITPAELKLQAQVITVDVRASGFTDFQAFVKGSRSISVAVFIDFCRRIYPILLTLSENYPPIYLTIDTDKRRARLLLEDKSLVSLLPLDSSMTILEDDDALILEWKEKDNA